MQNLRENYPREIAGIKTTAFSDYKASEKINLLTADKTAIDLPKTNMIILELDGGASVIVRPSGTEPKIKVYYTTVGKTQAEAEQIREKIATEFKGNFK